MQKIIQSQGGDETASLHFNFIISEVSTMVDGYTELANLHTGDKCEKFIETEETNNGRI